VNLGCSSFSPWSASSRENACKTISQKTILYTHFVKPKVCHVGSLNRLKICVKWCVLLIRLGLLHLYKELTSNIMIAIYIKSRTSWTLFFIKINLSITRVFTYFIVAFSRSLGATKPPSPIERKFIQSSDFEIVHKALFIQLKMKDWIPFLQVAGRLIYFYLACDHLPKYKTTILHD